MSASEVWKLLSDIESDRATKMMGRQKNPPRPENTHILGFPYMRYLKNLDTGEFTSEPCYNEDQAVPEGHEQLKTKRGDSEWFDAILDLREASEEKYIKWWYSQNGNREKNEEAYHSMNRARSAAFYSALSKEKK